jgi:alkylation response protein AidB-like acyl-CoA dehydrogenase
MDFELDEDQRAIGGAVDALLAQHAGPARAIELARKGDYDHALDAALGEAGFLDVARGDGTGPLEAALVVEAIAREAGVVAAGATALVAPCLADRDWAGPVALARADAAVPVRFAAQACTILVLDGDVARVVEPKAGDVRPVHSNFGYPMGVIAEEVLEGGGSLGSGSGVQLLAWWRVALAVECVGSMEAALAQTVAYVTQRRQFGRTIGSFQAVQHRLAQRKLELEGSRWLAYEAAYRRAPVEASATACAYAVGAAARTFRELHQLSGAIGFTREHDLHVWSMRLKALELELGGAGAHRRALAGARWMEGADAGGSPDGTSAR